MDSLYTVHRQGTCFCYGVPLGITGCLQCLAIHSLCSRLRLKLPSTLISLPIGADYFAAAPEIRRVWARAISNLGTVDSALPWFPTR